MFTTSNSFPSLIVSLTLFLSPFPFAPSQALLTSRVFAATLTSSLPFFSFARGGRFPLYLCLSSFREAAPSRPYRNTCLCQRRPRRPPPIHIGPVALLLLAISGTTHEPTTSFSFIITFELNLCGGASSSAFLQRTLPNRSLERERASQPVYTSHS